MSFNGFGYGQGYQNTYGQTGYGYQIPPINNPNPNYNVSPMSNFNQQQANNVFAYCNGIEGAKGYNMPPNSTVLLMDNDNPYFYIKTSDVQGRSSIHCYEFKEVADNQKEPKGQKDSVDFSQFAKVDDITVLSQKIDELKSLLTATETKPQIAKKGV